MLQFEEDNLVYSSYGGDNNFVNYFNCSRAMQLLNATIYNIVVTLQWDTEISIFKRMVSMTKESFKNDEEILKFCKWHIIP